MGHKKYMLVGDVEVPYEHHPHPPPTPHPPPPTGLSENVFLYIYMLFLMKHVVRSKFTGNIVKITILNMAAMKKMTLNEKLAFP